ncbi:DUF4333 domain-containing protein [Rhodococcus sp. TAF43]|uniref:DUF4333 domain-containing protein n=1 Tax=Rhodococcus sp. TAF43 TaxID=3237483 RepID=UPI003F95F700
MNPPDQQSSKRPLMIPLIAVSAVAVLAIVVAAFLLGRQSSGTSTAEPAAPAPGPVWPIAPTGPLEVLTLDKVAAERGIEQILTESYGVRDVSAVQCPGKQEVADGSRFECTIVAGGTNQKVTVTFTDDEGTYEVSRPVPAGR